MEAAPFLGYSDVNFHKREAGMNHREWERGFRRGSGY